MRGKPRTITKIDDWDKFGAPDEKRCDLSDNLRVHQKGDIIYHSLFKSTNDGKTLTEIKSDESNAAIFCEKACWLLRRLIIPDNTWCIVTTPRRRHFEGLHFATRVCELIAKELKIKFYDNALQCINKDRINPEFYLLRDIAENKVIIFDDIITTGKTLIASRKQFEDKEIVMCVVGIKN